MATQLLTLSVLPKGKPIKRIPSEVALPKGAPSSEIYQALSSRSGCSVYRLRVTKGSDGTVVPNEKDYPISRTGLLDGSTIHVKDLGPQIGWRTVYVIEYFGPILFHILVFQLRPHIFSNPNPGAPFPAPSTTQSLSMFLIVLHFLKREIETVFVHRFSSSTMPVFNVFKNSLYYWFVGGLFTAYLTYSPTAPAAQDNNSYLLMPGIILYVVGELYNFYLHIYLRSLRSPGTKERRIPNALGFSWVTCPNYMFEIFAWIGLILITKCWMTVVFLTIGTVQMVFWAKKKERNYRKEFGDKYKRKRFTIMPGII